jgi:hypothetical protein
VDGGDEMDGYALVIGKGEVGGIEFAAGRAAVDEADEFFGLGGRYLGAGRGEGKDEQKEADQETGQPARQMIHGMLLQKAINRAHHRS